MPLSRNRRRAVTIAAGAALLGILAIPLVGQDTSTRLERVTTTPPPPTALATALTKTTRTTQFMNGETDETLVRKLAERYVEAVNTHDNATIAELNCAKAAPGLIQIAAAGRPVTLGGLARSPSPDRYNAEFTIDGEPSHRMSIIRRDGVWCVRD